MKFKIPIFLRKIFKETKSPSQHKDECSYQQLNISNPEQRRSRVLQSNPLKCPDPSVSEERLYSRGRRLKSLRPREKRHLSGLGPWTGQFWT